MTTSDDPLEGFTTTSEDPRTVPEGLRALTTTSLDPHDGL